jgi:hypothetical protein
MGEGSRTGRSRGCFILGEAGGAQLAALVP